MKICERCKTAPGIVNLNTAQRVNDGESGPNIWLCTVCLFEGVNSPEARALGQADYEMEKQLDAGGRLN
jgi:hypothetical protein